MGHRFGCGDGSCIDWYRRHGVRVFSALSSGCLVYGAFVAAVAVMVSVLAWAVRFQLFAENDQTAKS